MSIHTYILHASTYIHTCIHLHIYITSTSPLCIRPVVTT